MHPQPGLLLELRVAGRRLFTPHDQVDQLAIVEPGALVGARDHGLPCHLCELGPVLGAAAPPWDTGRRQALGVALADRTVVFLVDRVEGLTHEATVQPLPPPLGAAAVAPWLLGAVAGDDGDAPALVIDLRRIATELSDATP